uniref:calhepatin-like n=1 Tax=Myxine glutinosa TaxID=7769 RepID=UPI00358F4C0B
MGGSVGVRRGVEGECRPEGLQLEGGKVYKGQSEPGTKYNNLSLEWKQNKLIMAFKCDQRDVNKCFIAADKDKSGMLSKEEILKVMRDAAYPIPEDFDKMLDGVDLNKDGKIEYGEFAKIYSNNLR